MDLDIQSLSQIANFAGQAFSTTERGVSLVRTVQSLFEKSEAGSDADIKAAMANLASQIGDAALTNAKLKLEIAEIQQAVPPP